MFNIMFNVRGDLVARATTILYVDRNLVAGWPARRHSSRGATTNLFFHASPQQQHGNITAIFHSPLDTGS
jgi:hypothetical protein